MFSQPLVFASIPKAYGVEAATHFPLSLLGGSLIPIVVYRDGDGFPLAKYIQGGNPFNASNCSTNHPNPDSISQ